VAGKCGDGSSAVVFGVMIWAATIAILEEGLCIFIVRDLWGSDVAGVLALLVCLVAFPLIAVVAMPVGLFRFYEVKRADRLRQDG
jgi:hypothetical protein